MELEHALPLGLGTLPTVHTGRMSPGDRLLLYTDGITESRLPDGRFIDLARIARPLADNDSRRAST